MSFGTRTLLALAALLALSGVAAAQCIECDPDGLPGDGGHYGSVDTGTKNDHGDGVVDTDVSVPDEGDDSFWVWISICITVIFVGLEDALGFDTGLDASADLFGGEDGLDPDASADLGPVCDVAAEHAETVDCTPSLDGTPAGDLDGQTWDAMADLHEAGVPHVGMPADASALDEVDEDHCVGPDLGLVGCG